jgi:hypothetical protein
MTRTAAAGVGELSRGGLVEGIRLVYDCRREDEIHVTNAPSDRWPESRPDARVRSEAVLAEERLAFTDRIIGLEEQVRELQAASRLSPSEQVAVEANLAGIRSSLTWRAGRIVTLPLRVLRVVKRRVLG